MAVFGMFCFVQIHKCPCMKDTASTQGHLLCFDFILFIISSFLRCLLRIRSSAGTSNMNSSEFIISSFLRRLLRIRSSAGTSNMKSSEFIISTTLRQKSGKTPFSRTRGRVHMEHIRPTHASMRVRLCSMLTFAFANIISHFYASAKVCETISPSPKIQFHMLQS